MPIRNKDGTLFKLQGINPLMKDQDHWENDEEGWQIHYVESEEDVVVRKEPSREAQRPLPQPPNPIPAPKPKEPEPQRRADYSGYDRLLLYCLPVTFTSEDVDPLYGQKKRIPIWGDKFNFEAVCIDSNGLTAVFFATLPDDVAGKLERGSILYVFKERQWWKINGTQREGDGVKIYCMPSPLKPSFT